ncbi:hypothetical protein [Janthinobacterium sp. PSPC3-1]|uniref:hypothetical protein n=1 Tax=Janthinobacterium sp. PSPC3-1 TaxID=2804653 RepID=UPI003CEBF24E
MKNIHYMTLATIRMQDPVSFDAMISTAISNAVRSVGDEVFVAAMRAAEPKYQVEQIKIAA